MEPILSQEEIRELLAAIKSGAVPLDDDDPAGFRHCRPLNLFDAARRRESDKRVVNLDLIVDAFAKSYATALTNSLQRTCFIQKNSINCMPFQNYVAEGQKNSGGIGMFSLQPLRHSALLTISADLAFSLVEIMLGAAKNIGGLHPERDLTTIELSIVKSLIALAADDFDRAFAPLVRLRSVLERVERNMRMVSIADPDAEVIVTSFQLIMGDVTGNIDLVVSLAAIDPLRDKLKELPNVNVLTRNSWRVGMRKALARVEATVIAQSGVVTMEISDILGLKPGDIIPLDYDPNTPLKILVEDEVKFYGQAGSSGGKKAVSITAFNM